MEFNASNRSRTLTVMNRIYALSALALAVIFIAGMAGLAIFGRGNDRFAGCRSGQVAGAAQIGGPFELVNTAGETVSAEEVITGPSLVYFGYTFCPDVCPLDAARNAEAVDLLEAAGHEVTPIFISVDPARDTPEVLAEFTGYLHPRMIGLTGTPDQVKQAAESYKVYFRAQDSADKDYYLVDHTTFTYLVMPGDGFVEFFRRELKADQLAGRVACFLDAAS